MAIIQPAASPLIRGAGQHLLPPRFVIVPVMPPHSNATAAIGEQLHRQGAGPGQVAVVVVVAHVYGSSLSEGDQSRALFWS
jgi:hypothetical protein